MATPTPRRDPLLRAARLLLVLIMVLAALAALAREGGGALPPETLWAIAAGLAVMAVISLLSIHALRLLRRIIDSVAVGDPFIPDNAVRLQQMAWLSAAIQALLVPVAGFGGWVAAVAHRIPSGSGLSLGGILLTLLLFILARVFRQGAAMREELEGTV